MKIVVFGGSGLIGDGFVRESLAAGDVTEVVAVGRSPLAITHPKLRSVALTDFTDVSGLADELAGADACFWSLGVSAGTVSAQDYERITYDYAKVAATALASINPDLTFVYVSGGGTDSSEQGRSRWARVKGRTENMVIDMFANGYALRPGFVEPAHGKRSNTFAYRVSSILLTPVFPLLRAVGLGPKLMNSSALMGQAALNLTRNGYRRHVLENRDILAAAGGATDAN